MLKEKEARENQRDNQVRLTSRAEIRGGQKKKQRRDEMRTDDGKRNEMMQGQLVTRDEGDHTG